MGRALFYSLFLGGLSLVAVPSFANTPRNHQTQTEEPPKDDTNLPEFERRKRLEQNIIFGQTLLSKIPSGDKNKPIARTEDQSVKNETKNEGQGNSPRNDASSQRKVIEVEEIVNFTPKQAEEALKFVLQNNKFTDEFAKFTEDKVDLSDALQALGSEGKLQVDEPTTIQKSQAASIYLEKDPARIMYLAAAFKFKMDTEAKTEKVDPKAQTQKAIDASAIRLGSSLASKTNAFNPNPVSLPDLSSVVGGYIDLAAKQIVNAGNERSSLGDDQNLTSPFKNATELNKLFENALNSANSLDLNSRSLAEKIKPFSDLVKSKEFLENGPLVLGKENAEALISSVQAAELLEAANGNVNAAGIDYLSGAFNLGTGISAPPCIGCVENKGSSIPANAETYSSSDEYVNAETQDWIDEARYLSDIASKNRGFDPKEIAALNKGRAELEKLLSSLDLYRSLGVLNFVKSPSQFSMSRHYKDAAELAAGVLFNVRQKKIKADAPPVALQNIQKVKKSADDLLSQLKIAKTPAKIENALRSFFEKSEHKQVRELWKNYEGVNYKKLRSLTAQVMMSRAFSMLKLPTFERATTERASLAFLVNRSFESIRLHKEKVKKEKQLQMGILELPGIKMADEKEKSKTPERKPSNTEAKKSN